MKAFANALLEELDIGEKATRVGVVKYGRVAATVLHLTDSYDVTAIQNTINDTGIDPGIRWGSNMALSIKQAVTEFTSRGRPVTNTARKAVIISTYPPSDTARQQKEQTDSAQNNNITIYTVGIGQYVDPDTLRRIAQNDSSKVYLSASVNSSLDLIGDLAAALLPISACTCRGVPGPAGEKGERGVAGPKGEGGGSVYTRWGRTSCPYGNGATSKVYDGYAAGTRHNSKGGGANMLCLPKNPVYSTSRATHHHGYAALGAVEYEGNAQLFRSQHNAPCAVCTTTRNRQLMIPGTTQCPAGWTREYWGYLVSEHHDHYRSEFLCFDSRPETIPGTQGDHQSSAEVYTIEIDCEVLPCPPYSSTKELTCVVCTK